MLFGERTGHRLTKLEQDFPTKMNLWEEQLLRKAKEDQELIKNLYYENIKLEKRINELQTDRGHVDFGKE